MNPLNRSQTSMISDSLNSPYLSNGSDSKIKTKSDLINFKLRPEGEPTLGD